MQAVIFLAPAKMFTTAQQVKPPNLATMVTTNLNRGTSHSLVQLTPATSLVPQTTSYEHPRLHSTLVVTRSAAANAPREVLVTAPNQSPEEIDVDDFSSGERMHTCFTLAEHPEGGDST